MKKRFLSLILSISFILSLLTVPPIGVSAADDNKCGDNLTWEIITDNSPEKVKTLIIRGSGAMYDYDYDYDTTDIDMPPWAEYLGVKHQDGKVTGLDSLSGIGYLDLSNDITHIGNYAFYRFTSLFKPAELPAELESIGKYAFRECTDLYQVKFGDNLKEIGVGAFYKCTALAKIFPPESLTSIGNYAFAGCTALANITLYSGLETIGQNAFKDCSKLVAITIPDTVTSIGAYAFNNCTAMTSVDFNNSPAVISNFAFLMCSALAEVSNMTAVTSIGTQAFYGCTKLESVTISKSVSSIGAAAFSACLSLKEINVDSENTKYASIDGNLFNKDITILYQYALGKKAGVYAIPDTVKGISALSFAYCNLKSLGMGKNVTTIGQDILSHSKALVYYEGSESDLAKISVNEKNDDLKANLIYNTPLYGVISDVTTDNGNVVLTANYAFGKNSDCLAYVGIYDMNGALVNAVKADNAETEFVLSDTEIAAGYTARLFFWNDETELKPIGITTSLKL